MLLAFLVVVDADEENVASIFGYLADVVLLLYLA